MSTAERIETYLAALDPSRRERMETIRAAIVATAPDAVEDMLYAMPGFRWHTKHLAAYAAAKKHDGFYPCSGGVIATLPQVLQRFRTTSGAVHLPLDEPVDTDVIAQLVRTRMAEIESGGR
ncbi:iron chaperone [Williamsia sp. CHRR-6]|uniref:iron chaperone n=1 Tax=Williamsia sp. CHRR-6 TaxID=2835871 RepID=UPI001BDB48A6|nr:DUF1801 domain-containing protein [Williamsia sp. CHRR-6]MBT0567605.1 DUF1801 domain-containing protein [Williamsia sp. CHRR-6]